MLRVYRLPRARLYLIGDAISSLGDYALWLAVGVWVKELTGSTSDAGLAFFMLTLGTLTSPLTGMIVDRHRRRPLLITVNLATALVVMALTLVHGRGDVWIAYVVMLLYGVSGGLSSGAQTALLPQLVPDDLLAEANSLLQFQTQGLRLISPAVGVGLLSLLGGGTVAGVDAGTFAVAAALLRAVPVAEERPVPSERHWAAEAAAGVRHIVRTTVLRQLTIACAVAVLALGFFETLVYAIATVGLHRPASFVGVFVTAQGVGALIAGPTAPLLLRRITGGLLVAVGLVISAGSCLLMIASNTATVVSGAVAFGVALPWLIIGVMVTVQRLTPSELMGRVDGALNLLITGPQALAIAAGAGLVAIVPYRDLLWGMAGGLAAIGTWLATRRTQWRTVPEGIPGEAESEAAIA